MAIAIVGSTSTNSAAADAAYSLGHTVDAGTEILVVLVGMGSSSGGGSVTSITWSLGGGQSLTRVTGAQSSDGHWGSAEIWYRLSPTAGTGTLTLNLSGQIDSGVGATNFSGIDTGTPFGTAATASVNTGTTVSVGVSYASGDYVLAALGSDSNTANGGATPTGTQLWEAENINSDTAAAGQYYSGGGGGTQTAQWTIGNNQASAIVGVALKALGGGGGGRTTKNTRAWGLGMELGMNLWGEI